MNNKLYKNISQDEWITLWSKKENMTYREAIRIDSIASWDSILIESMPNHSRMVPGGSMKDTVEWIKEIDGVGVMVIRGGARIHKSEDDWFIVRIEQRWRGVPEGETMYWRCDQIEGVIELLTDKLDDRRYLVGKTK
jgi:hypothetical protein